MITISGTLLARLQEPARNEAAWGRLTELYGPAVYSRCRKAGIPAQDVADVGQEVFLDVTKCVAEFRRDRPGDTFRGWLARITQRRIVDYWRHRQRMPEGEAVGGSVARGILGQVPDHHDQGQASGSTPPQTGSSSDTFSAEADSEEVEALRRRALELIESRFEPTTWRACYLVVLEGKPVGAAAEELGISENAVRVAKSKVLRSVREDFGELLGDLLADPHD